MEVDAKVLRLSYLSSDEENMHTMQKESELANFPSTSGLSLKKLEKTVKTPTRKARLNQPRIEEFLSYRKNAAIHDEIKAIDEAKSPIKFRTDLHSAKALELLNRNNLRPKCSRNTHP